MFEYFTLFSHFLYTLDINYSQNSSIMKVMKLKGGDLI